MHCGYIKLWRKLLESDLLKHPKLLSLWIYCLMKASHRHKRIIINHREVFLEPGQFIFGRKQAAEDLGMTEREIRTRFSFLKKAQNVTSRTTNRYTVVSIVNWDTYQGNGDTERPAERPADDQQTTTNKNIKNIKKKYICPFEAIKTKFNDALGDVLPAVRVMSDERKRNLNSRWIESHESRRGLRSDTLEFWDGFFAYVRQSEFLMGAKNDWRANFDFLIKKNKFIKILEGQYHK